MVALAAVIVFAEHIPTPVGIGIILITGLFAAAVAVRRYRASKGTPAL